MNDNPVEVAREIRARLGDLLRDVYRLEGLEDGSRDWEIAVGHLARAGGSMARAIEQAPLRYLVKP
jgi:hypothetical protein